MATGAVSEFFGAAIFNAASFSVDLSAKIAAGAAAGRLPGVREAEAGVAVVVALRVVVWAVVVAAGVVCLMEVAIPVVAAGGLTSVEGRGEGVEGLEASGDEGPTREFLLAGEWIRMVGLVPKGDSRIGVLFALSTAECRMLWKSKRKENKRSNKRSIFVWCELQSREHKILVDFCVCLSVRPSVRPSHTS